MIDKIRQEITHPDIRRGFDYWCLLRGDRDFPCRADLDPIDIPHLLHIVSLIDVLADPVDFRFRLIGARPAAGHSVQIGQSAFDLTEKEGRARILARYQRCIEGRGPVLDIYENASTDQGVFRIEAITCPLSDDNTAINMMLSFGCGEIVYSNRPRQGGSL